MGQRVSLQEELINMKITSKQMVSASKKCEKNEKKYRKDVKKAIEKGNAEGARIYAQNAIREKNSGLNYLRMSARIDAVAQRLDTVVKNQAMQKSIVKVNKGLSSALKSMNVEKISKEMDAFEKQFEDIDVRAKCDLGVLRCFPFVAGTRIMLWVVSFPISMLRAGTWRTRWATLPPLLLPRTRSMLSLVKWPMNINWTCPSL